MDLFRHFAFSNFLPIGLCNFNSSPLWGALISCLFFVPWPFLLVLPFILGVVSGVLLVVLSVVLCDASLSASCTRVYVSLVHSGVQILRLAVAVAVPLGAAKQRFIWSSGGLWVRPARLGVSPTPRAAAHFACDESSRYSAVIGLCRTFAETSGRHCRVG